MHAIDEALRNLVAVGGNLDRTAILDNFCWGNCNKPDRMGALVQAAKACREAALTYSTPFVSGKDSLNNEFQTADGKTIAIPPTLLISAISVIEDSTKCVTMDLKKEGNLLFLLGLTRSELGGSHFLTACEAASGNDVPPVDCKANLLLMKKLQSAIESGLVRSCHDLSEGGLAVAATEMAFAGGLGVEIDPDAIPVVGRLASATAEEVSLAAKLFGESAGRFLVEIEPDRKDAFLETICEAASGKVGQVTDSGRVKIGSVIDLGIDEAKQAWQGTFDW